MRRFPLLRARLGVLLPLGALIVFSLFLAVGVLFAQRAQLQSLLLNSEATVRAESFRLAQLAERKLQSDPALVEASLTQLATVTPIAHAALVDADGQVVMATRLAWRGRPAAQVIPNYDAGLWRAALVGVGLQLQHDPQASHLRSLLPFSLAAREGELRGLRQGLVYIEYDYSRQRQQIGQRLWRERGVEWLVGMFGTLLLTLFLRWWMVRPLAELERAATRIAAGDHGVRVAVEGPAEIAAVGVAFNAMNAELSQTLGQLAESEERLSITLRSIGDGLIATDTEGRVTLLNPVAERMTGWTLDEARGRPVGEVFRIRSALTGEPAEIPVQRVLDTGMIVGLANHTELLAQDGTIYQIADSAAPILDDQGRLHGVVMAFQDVTEDYRLRAELEQSRVLNEAVLNSTRDAIVAMDLDGRITLFNAGAERLFGISAAEALGRAGYQLMLGEDGLRPASRASEAAFEMGNHRPARSPLRDQLIGRDTEWQFRRQDGEWVPVSIMLSELRTPEGKLLGYLTSSRDISERKRAEQEIERLAFYDPLTALPNRRLLMDRLQHALAVARRSGHYGALFFIDLDFFKHLNDARGHAVGDELLVQVATRFQAQLREQDTVARLGGDEFVVLLEGLGEQRDLAAEQARAMGERLRAALMQPFDLSDGDHSITASIGVTLFPEGGEGALDLLKEADTAMYRAKQLDRNAVCFYEPALQQAAEERLALDRELRHALQQGEFRLLLQPQVDHRGDIVGAEALVRWQHPERGLVAPGAFIAAAEESGLIAPIGEWVLAEACAVVRRASERGRPLRVSVNVSPRQFRQSDFADRVADIVFASGADPQLLTLELTEGLVIQEIADTIVKMSALRELGIQFSIDDFGTGYSSLAYLKRLPLNELKIDRSFIQDAPYDSSDAALVETILAVARHLGLVAVAEGVETAEQAAFLDARGCPLFQGYFFGMPMPESELIERCG
jgi:diguanylate cyclase (GGDEF)-like protein/PAS domain S-box-containing protein